MEYNPFDILGIEPTQDASAIKRAYRKLAKQHHPDVGGNAEAFAKVQRAYEVLTTPHLFEEWKLTGLEPGAKRSEEDERRKRVVQILVQHIEAALEEDEWTCIVQEVRESLQLHEKELRKALEEGRKQRAKLEKRLARIRKGPLLHSILRGKIEAIDRGLLNGEAELEIIAIAQHEAQEMEEDEIERPAKTEQDKAKEILERFFDQMACQQGT